MKSNLIAYLIWIPVFLVSFRFGLENQNISIIAELFSVKGNNRYFCEETGEINMYLEIAKKVAGYLKTESNGDYKL